MNITSQLSEVPRVPSELRQPTARVEVRVHFPSKFEATHKNQSWKMGWDLGEERKANPLEVSLSTAIG